MSRALGGQPTQGIRVKCGKMWCESEVAMKMILRTTTPSNSRGAIVTDNESYISTLLVFITAG